MALVSNPFLYEIRGVMDDCRSVLYGNLQCGLDIWEMAVMPMLMFNSECWIGIREKDVDELEAIQKVS